MSADAAAGNTLLTEAPPPAAAPSAVPPAAATTAEKAVQAVQDGPPEYIPPKFWDAEKRQARIEDLGRSYINLEKLMGREKVPVPAGDDDEEGWQRWYAASGRPEKPDDYEFERPALPQDMPYDEDGEKFLRQWAHQNGLNKKQTSRLYQDYAKMQLERHTKWGEMQKQAKTEAQHRVQTEFGQQFEQAKSQAHTVMAQYADPEFRQWLDETGNGNDPRFFRFVARIGKDMTGETKLKGTPQPTASPADYEKAIADFRSQHHKALFDRSHPDHERLTREYTALFQKAYG
jgi:hypothetical protein